MRTWSLAIAVVGAIGASACAKNEAPLSPSAGISGLPAPTPAGPADSAQLTTLRPTLTVTNSAASATGTRTYEFQVSDSSTFTTTASPGSFPVIARMTGVSEGAGTT